MLAVNFFNFVFTAIGIRAKLQLDYCGLLVHGTYMTAIIGGYYAYLILEFLFTKDQESATSNMRDEKAES